MTLETKDLPIFVTKASETKGDGPAGLLEAIVAVFGNVDMSGERIVQGAFDASLAKKLPKGVWAHDWKRPIAKTLEAREVPPGDPILPEHLKELGGLYIKAQFNLDTQDGRDAFSNVSKGLFDEYSIGYYPTGRREAENALELTEIDLYEWSPVMVGCNRATATISAKGAAKPDGEQDAAPGDKPDEQPGEKASDAESYSLHLRGALALAEIAV